MFVFWGGCALQQVSRVDLLSLAESLVLAFRFLYVEGEAFFKGLKPC